MPLVVVVDEGDARLRGVGVGMAPLGMAEIAD